MLIPWFTVDEKDEEVLGRTVLATDEGPSEMGPEKEDRAGTDRGGVATSSS